MALPTDIATLHQMIHDLRSLVESQAARIQELEARLNQTSKNSHRPPSSEGYRKRAVLPKEKKRGGGQKGHKGDTLQMVSEVDDPRPLFASVCSCGQVLNPTDQQLRSCRQVFDLPEPKLYTIEYQQFGCQCPSCGASCQGEFPAGVSAPAQYGPGVKALGVLLTQGYCLSLEKAGQLFEDLFGYRPNDATLLQAQQTVYEQLEASEEVIKTQLVDSNLAHADETGMRVEGKLQWLHTVSNALWTYLYMHPKRGREAFESSESILRRLSQWLVHDCWSSYFKLEEVFHALCGAHLLRELQAQIDQGRQWATQMQALLLELYKQSLQADGPPPDREATLARFEAICKQADEEEPPPEPRKRGKPKRTKGRNLFERMQTHREAVLAFAFHPEVPFTNNQAERDIRPLKLKQKVAGCFRTSTGAKHFARIQGFISTTRKHQRNVFKELRSTFSGQTFITLEFGS